MRKFHIVFLLLTAVFALSAQDVVREELFSVNRDSVEFLNYEGPHVKFETAAQIEGIGKALGSGVSAESGRSGYFDKYRVIRVIDPNGGDRLNADIFIIEKEAQVDHIKNVRRIISGYLESFYKYTPEDAGVIAEFATYYNAFYRKNMEYFTLHYAPEVIKNLDPEKAGISTRYSEWSGGTQMLIPLSSTGGEKVDTDTISNNEVIEDLRTKEDKGIEPRKGMVELKEKEIAREEQEIQKEKESLEAEKKAVEEEKAVSGDTEEVARKEEAIKEKEEALKDREEDNTKRQEAVQQEREQIAKDEKQIIEENKAKEGIAAQNMTSAPDLVPFLLVDTSEPPFMGSFVLIDRATGRIDKKSSMNTVRGREYHVLNGSLLFISGMDKPPKAVRLMTMNKDTLKVEKEGENDIYEYSALLVSGDSIYAVTRDSGKWYAGRFDSDLKLKAKSEMEVLPYTPLMEENGILYVETGSGSIVPLDMKSLRSPAQ